MRSVIKNFVLVLNLFACLLLFAASMAQIVSPAKVWWLVFLGISFPIFVIIQLFFIGFWLVARKKHFLISLISLLLVSSSIQTTFSFFPKKSASIKEQKLKIMSYNVKNFDLYNWTNNLATRQKMLRMIAAENPDIICFQEFYNQDTLAFRNRTYFTDSLGYKYSYFKDAVTHHSLIARGSETRIARKWGLAIFSRLPIIDSGAISFEKTLTNTCCWADIQYAGKAIRVYNMHLQSIRLGYEDYLTLQEIELNQSARWWDIKAILRKLKTAASKRAGQVDLICESMQVCTHPRIVCGDFNDLPISYSVYQIGKGLQDAFVEKGIGFGATYVNKLPFFRIDHIFLDKKFVVKSYKTIKEEYSDHYPLVVEFGEQK